MRKEYVFIILSGILYGGIVFGGKILSQLGLSAYEAAVFYPAFMLLLLPIIIFSKKHQFKKGMVPFFLGFGVAGAVAVFCQFVGVFLGVPVAVAALLLYSQPIWTLMLSSVFLDEKINKYKSVAVFVAILGIIVLVNPFTIDSLGHPLGLLFSLIGGLGISGWTLYSKKSSIKKYSEITTWFGAYVFSLIVLLFVYPLISFFISDPQVTRLSFFHSWQIWGSIFLVFLFGSFLPFIFLLKGLKKVPASHAGVILLLEPVSAALLAFIFLKEPLTQTILLGGSLILFANYIVIKKG